MNLRIRPWRYAWTFEMARCCVARYGLEAMEPEVLTWDVAP